MPIKDVAHHVKWSGADTSEVISGCSEGPELHQRGYQEGHRQRSRCSPVSILWEAIFIGSVNYSFLGPFLVLVQVPRGEPVLEEECELGAWWRGVTLGWVRLTFHFFLQVW